MTDHAAMIERLNARAKTVDSVHVDDRLWFANYSVIRLDGESGSVYIWHGPGGGFMTYDDLAGAFDWWPHWDTVVEQLNWE